MTNVNKLLNNMEEVEGPEKNSKKRDKTRRFYYTCESPISNSNSNNWYGNFSGFFRKP